MRIKLKELADLIGGELDGPADKVVTGARSLVDAGPDDVAYYQDAKLEEILSSSQAGCVILSAEQKGKAPWPGAKIYHPHPQWGFTLALRMHARTTARKLRKGIHPAAVVDPTAKIGPDACVLANVVVEPGAEIGARVVLHPGSYVGADARLGDDCLLHPGARVLDRCSLGHRVILQAGAVVGSDGFGYCQVDGRHEKIPQLGRVVVEDDVEIGANAAIDRATHGETRIGRGTKIDNLAQIAHNCTIGADCIVVSQVGIAGSSFVGDGAILAGQAGIPDHTRIGKGAVVMAQAGVLKDVPDGAVVFGSPARPAKEAMRLHAMVGKLPSLMEDVRALKRALKETASSE